MCLQAVPESERWRLAAIMHPVQLLPGHDLTQAGSSQVLGMATACCGTEKAHRIGFGGIRTAADWMTFSYLQEGEPATCLWLLQVCEAEGTVRFQAQCACTGGSAAAVQGS
jgi:hypothetical protein